MSARRSPFFAAALALVASASFAAVGCGTDPAGEADAALDADAISDVAPEIGPDIITLRDADASVPPDTTPDAARDVPPKPDATEDAAPQPDLTPPPPLLDPCATGAAALERAVRLPLGETLFFDRDDYLSFWPTQLSCAPTLAAAPDGAVATLGPDGRRVTPDVAGEWRFSVGAETLVVTVDDAPLTADSFLNFNYTPVEPLAQAPDGAIWVVNPPSNTVQRVTLDGDTATAAELVPTGSWPTALAVWPGTDLMLVSQTGRDSLGFLDLNARRVVDAIAVGNEPAGIALDLDAAAGPQAWVVLGGEDSVVRVDLGTRAVTATVAVGHEPRAVTFDPATRRLYVASLISGNARPSGPLQKTLIPEEDQHDIAVIDVDSAAVVGQIVAVGTIIRDMLLLPGTPKRMVVAHTEARNDKNGIAAGSRPHEHGLAIVDLEPGSPTQWRVVKRVDLDTQPSSSGPAASPYSMALTPSGDRLIVSLSAGRALLYLNATTYAEEARVMVGADPRGLVLAGERVWTSPWLDGLLVGAPLSPTVGSGATMPKVSIGRDPTPDDVREGQRMFNDAAFSANGDFSCNNCHIDGLTDGLVWNILLDGDVNTLAFRNVGGTGPFLWGGFLPTLFDFSREVLRLVGANATGVEMELLTNYMQSVTAPPNPYTLPGGRLTEAGLRGRALFHTDAEDGGGGCAACHSGPLFTNGEQVPGKTEGFITDVPSLLGAYDTGPWGRHAQWPTLEAMVEYAATFTEATLSAAELADLTAYVRQLPSDLLYLTSARPLDGARSVWNQTPVELVFSALLKDGQASKLRMATEAGAAVAGSWAVSGRRARFVPDGGELALETDYVITIDAGLQAVLGERLAEPIRIEFSTGAVPAFEVAARWRWTVTGAVSGTMEMAFIQSKGGRLSGVVLDGGGLVDADHLEGVLVGDTMIIEPFLVSSPFGQVLVDEVVATMVDDDKDGLADSGKGTVNTALANLKVTMKALAGE
ncbi:MAG: Ig-like domain-containing protein [Myxococcota bacterium]